MCLSVQTVLPAAPACSLPGAWQPDFRIYPLREIAASVESIVRPLALSWKDRKDLSGNNARADRYFVSAF